MQIIFLALNSSSVLHISIFRYFVIVSGIFLEVTCSGLGRIFWLMAFLCSVSTVCVPLHENVLLGVHEFFLVPSFCAKFFIFKRYFIQKGD